MHLFAVGLSSATGSLTEQEASFSSFLVSGSSPRTESQVFVDDVDIDAFSSQMPSNLVTNCFSNKKKKITTFATKATAVIIKRTPGLRKQQ